MSDKQEYIPIRFTLPTYKLIDTIDKILTAYSTRGMPITVRQLYYRLVTKNLIENTEKSYKRIVKVCTDARMAGLLPWDGIEDRHRAWQRRQHWDNGKDFAMAAARSFHKDMWIGQRYRPFLLIEKDALSGVFSGPCHELDVPLLCCKGYLSASTGRDFATTDLRYAIADGQRPIVLHFGDHDPSGIDMTRDLIRRLGIFLEIEDPELRRKALNLDQVKRFGLAPNPTKQTDARTQGYRARFGSKCWELDAIEPEELQAMARRAIEGMIDWPLWERRQREIAAVTKKLVKHAKKFKG